MSKNPKIVTDWQCKQFAIKFASDDNSFDEAVAFEMPLEDWARALRFWHAAERLWNTRFVQDEMGGSISLTLSVESGLSSRAKDIDDEAVGNMLMKIRPFILQNEPDVNFHNIIKLLSRYAAHPFLRRELTSFATVYRLQRMQFAKCFEALGRPPMTVDEVMAWLNSFEYHFDPKKRRTVEQTLGLFGRDRNGLPVVLFAVVEMLHAILALSDFIETLAEFNNSEKAVVVPAKWLQEVEI